MKALLFGSIGNLSDTSEMQREAFNNAFAHHNLDWYWSRDVYRELLRQSGGRGRIASMAKEAGHEVEAAAIHATKSALFQSALERGGATPRPGVKDAIARARKEGAALGLVTTTSSDNVNQLLSALDLPPKTFDVIVTAEQVESGKPSPDCYACAAATLALSPKQCIDVEDNVDGVRAALAAGTPCLAWPGENNIGHDFKGARMVEGSLMNAVWSSTVTSQ